MTQGVTAVKVDEIIKPLLLKDLRIQCRARGLNPGDVDGEIERQYAQHWEYVRYLVA